MPENKNSGKFILIFFAVMFALLVYAKFHDNEPSVNAYEVMQRTHIPATRAIEIESLRRDKNNEPPLTEAEIKEIVEPITVNEINKLRAEKRIQN